MVNMFTIIGIGIGAAVLMEMTDSLPARDYKSLCTATLRRTRERLNKDLK